MYRIEDRSAYIKIIQKLLGQNETGIYTEKLKKAILEFQTVNNISPTGVVDLLTFSALIKKHKEAITKSNIKDNFLNLEAFPYTYGSIGSDVLYINTLFADLIKKYNLDVNSPRGSFYGADSSNAAAFFRRATLSEPGNSTDELLFYKILKLK